MLYTVAANRFDMLTLFVVSYYKEQRALVWSYTYPRNHLMINWVYTLKIWAFCIPKIQTVNFKLIQYPQQMYSCWKTIFQSKVKTCLLFIFLAKLVSKNSSGRLWVWLHIRCLIWKWANCLEIVINKLSSSINVSKCFPYDFWLV